MRSRYLRQDLRKRPPSLDDMALLRRRYECAECAECGYHGYREAYALPGHIDCPRCGGVAVARGATELVK